MRPSRRLVRALGIGAVAFAATACDGQIKRFGFKAPITVQGNRTLGLWQGSFWAALIIGGAVLGLILFACARYRRRGDELPGQVRYNVPIEVLYTVVPFIIIAVLFYFTAVDENFVTKETKNPDITIGVVGFQWAWQFNYKNDGISVTGDATTYPTLVLPIGERVRFVETSPDVIHAFWVPEFLFKRDVIPGRTNSFEVTLDKTGTFEGRCTELCGVYHSRMLFFLKSVSQADYATWLQTTKAKAQSGTDPMFTTISTTPTGSSS